MTSRIWSMGPDVDLGRMLADLSERKIGVVMVEGGEQVHTALLSAGLVDEIHLVVAPLIVGAGPRFLAEATYPWPTETRMEVIEIRPIGDVVMIRYRIPSVQPR